MRNRSYLQNGIFVAVLLAGCAHAPPKVATIRTQYSCVFTREFADGSAQATIYVLNDGTIGNTGLSWMSSIPEARRVWMRIFFDTSPSAGADVTRGVVVFDREIEIKDETGSAEYRNGERLVRPTLEIRVNGSPPWRGNGAIRDNFNFNTGVKLRADWADVQALARGNDQLYLVARNEGQVVDIFPIPNAAFVIPENEIEALFSETLSASKQPEKYCTDESSIPIPIQHFRPDQ